MKDVPWEDIFILSASATSEFCEQVQVGIDVYIFHCNILYLSCVTAIVHRNHFFYCTNKTNKSSEPKVQFRQTSNHCKRVVEVAKLAYFNKTKESITSQKLGSQDFWQIVNSVLNKDKPAIPPLFNRPDVLSSASVKAKLFAENFSKNSNLDDLGVSLPVFPSRTNVKLNNISVTPKMVKKGHTKVFQKLVNNRIVDHLEKCGLFSDLQYGYRSCQSTADLLTVVSDRIARVFNKSGATRAVVLDISMAFDRVWHAGLFQT